MIEQKNRSFFCAEPYKNLSANTEGHWKACCISNNRSIDFHNMTIDNTKIKDFYNSDFLTALREDQKNGRFSEIVQKNCEKCITDEKLGRKSRRLSQNAKYASSNFLDVSLDSLKIKHIGNLCNAKCITCRPLDSSLFALESHQLGEYIGEIIINSKPSATYLEGIKEIIPNLNSFRFTGGEPIINKLTWEFLEWLIQENCTDINLTFTTNAKVKLKKDQKEILSKFKEIKFAISVDGLDNRNYYIRYPIRYSSIIENTKTYSDVTDKINFITTVSNLNVGYLDELGDSLQSLFKYPWSYNNLVTKPSIFNPNNLPNDIKFKYKNSSVIADKLLNYSNGEKIDKFTDMLNFVIKRDKIRKTDIFEICPEFKKYEA